MQTFLPYADFSESAKALDSKRLGNQCYRETLTLLRGKWPNHPASKMWQGHEHSLAMYGLATAIEIAHRKQWSPNVAVRWLHFYTSQVNQLEDTGMPSWIGDSALHSSHRAALLYKDYDYYSKLGWSESPLVPDPVTGKLPYVWPIK